MRDVGLDQTAPGLADTGGSPGQARKFGIVWVFPQLEGRFTPLGDGRVVIGRETTCDVVLPSEQISRQHAAIRREGPLFVVSDLGSRNGSFVNQRPVKEAPLEPGAVVRIGDWVGVVVDAPISTGLPGSLFGPLSGDVIAGPALRAALMPALKAASSDLPIIVQGETGTGKEFVAQMIHERSGRPGRLLALNCAALPEQLAEAELFGVQKGAYTGADRARPGHFRAADNGTLFLDEVAELPLALQAKLLRVLEQREVLPLGESQPVRIDVRVVVAAQASLQRAVDEKRFRGDLLARLDGMTVTLPPLRSRREEIPSLLRFHLDREAGGNRIDLSPRLIETLCSYDWPFNVRQLALLARQLWVLHGQGDGQEDKDDGQEDKQGDKPVPLLRRSHLPEEYRRERTAVPAEEPLKTPAKSPFEAFVEALRASDGNVTKAAARIGISRPKAYRLMKELDIAAEDFRE
jgi:DNA-binding NtrC family response regulator